MCPTLGIISFFDFPFIFHEYINEFGKIVGIIVLDLSLIFDNASTGNTDLVFNKFQNAAISAFFNLYISTIC